MGTEAIPRLPRSWYSGSFDQFGDASDDQILAQLVKNSSYTILQSQRDAWLSQMSILRPAVKEQRGALFLEFAIPRMGKRIDAILLISGILIVLEFKIGSREVLRADIDQLYDYATDLKYFHEASHKLPLVPILVPSDTEISESKLFSVSRIEGLYQVLVSNGKNLPSLIQSILDCIKTEPVESKEWYSSRYLPTPTIIEAARALYAGHGVADISRSEAGAMNLKETSDRIERIIEDSSIRGRKSICFVTGVPGAGKTLVGLNMATKYNDVDNDLHSVFLSGNGPLVAILREALARDMVSREKIAGAKMKKGEAVSRVKAFIQNVHHFRDEGLRDEMRPPADHVAIFDEAQRAWNLEQTKSFMARKKGVPDFEHSEPEFLLSYMDRRQDWAAVICLVGGGQEINTGEAGIGAWIEAVRDTFPHWDIYISPFLTDGEYGAANIVANSSDLKNVKLLPELHLAVSMRSFRAERVSEFVKKVLDCEIDAARSLLSDLQERYPIYLTRKLENAKSWLRTQACGNERIGLIVSSQAERLKPHAIDVKTPVNPVKWFLDGKDDVRSSYYLEDVATEFHVQGLELDWACVCWDGDFRFSNNGWGHYSFRGTKWQRINKLERQFYLKNAYRVLLTRARQGMVIFVPEGSSSDPTRDPAFYDSTYDYLRSVGICEL
jgi:hypothetical protein